MQVTVDVLQGPRTLVIWNLFWESRSFCDLMRALEGITKKTLRRELAALVKYGLIRRDVRMGGPQRRVEYSLTPFGETLKPLVGTMYEWGLYYSKECRHGALSSTARDTALGPPIAVRH